MHCFPRLNYNIIPGLNSKNLSEEVGENESNDPPSKTFALKRVIGFWSGVLVSLNIIFGSGIFISPNGVFKAANGSVGISLLIWVFGGCVAALSTLCYGELATSIPESGGNLVYFHFAFEPAIAFLVPWMSVLVPTGDATQIMMFSNYALSPFLQENCLISPPFAVKLLSIATLLLIVFINCWSVKLTARIQSVFVAFKFVAMGLIFVGAIVTQVKGNGLGMVNFQNAFDEKVISGITYASISTAFYQVMWSYEGWPALTQISEEAKDVKLVIYSVLLTLIIVTASYVLLNVLFFLVLTREELMNSQLVAATFATKAFGGMRWLAPVTICICTMGCSLSSFLTFGRLSFVAARRGYFPRILSMLHTERVTPVPGLCCNAFFAIILIIIGDLNMLIEAFGFVGWISHAMSAAAVLVLRYRLPDLHRPFKVPTVVPVLVTLISTFFVVSEMSQNFSVLYIYVIAYFAIGLGVYYLLVKRNQDVCEARNLTLFLQKILSVAPEEKGEME